jgi:hypothetical protein
LTGVKRPKSEADCLNVSIATIKNMWHLANVSRAKIHHNYVYTFTAHCAINTLHLGYIKTGNTLVILRRVRKTTVAVENLTVLHISVCEQEHVCLCASVCA